jgi:hypothetical protein
MDSIRQQLDRDFDFYDFETLGEALEDDAADTDGFNLPLWSDDTPFRSARVIAYAGSPGAIVACPCCNLPGRRVDAWGGYACERCGYSNLQDLPRRSLH